MRDTAEIQWKTAIVFLWMIVLTIALGMLWRGLVMERVYTRQAIQVLAKRTQHLQRPLGNIPSEPEEVKEVEEK